jgi:membrane-associated protease RseP (regulator of RpoE activity)
MTRGTPILLGLLLLAPAAAPLSASDSPSDDRKIVIRDGEVLRLDDDGGPVVVQLDGRSRRGYIGVRPIEMTPDLRAHFGAPRDAGVLVGEVEADGPAAKAGLQVGDVVTAVDGEKIDSADLSRAIRGKKNGETVKLEVLRDKAKKTLSVAVAERKRTEIARNDARQHPGEHTFTIPDFDFRWPNRLDLDRLSDRLEELEKRLKDLEKKLSAR